MKKRNAKKNRIRASLPHRLTFTRLAPSPISGVGVFAVRNIKKGTDIFPNVDDEIIWIDKAKVRKLPKEIRRLYEDYCVRKGSQYGCPVSFNLINASWYLNHSSNPNVAVDKKLSCFRHQEYQKRGGVDVGLWDFYGC